MGRLVTNQAYCGVTYANVFRSVPPKVAREPDRHVNTRREVRPREEWIALPEATPAIVSAEFFQEVQDRLAAHRRLAARNARYEYLLRGHIECGWCGRRYYGEPMHGYRYYRCAGRRRCVSLEPCRNQTYEAGALEALVLEELRRTLLQPALIVAEVERQRQELVSGATCEADLRALDGQLVELAHRERRLLRAYTMGVFGDEALEEEHGVIGRQRETLVQRKAAVAARYRRLGDLRLSEDGVREFCSRVAHNMERFGPDDWRLALEALNVTVRVDGRQATMCGAIPIDVSAGPAPVGGIVTPRS